MKSLSVTLQMNAAEQYFRVALFIIMYERVHSDERCFSYTQGGVNQILTRFLPTICIIKTISAERLRTLSNKCKNKINKKLLIAR